jgi:membrane-bound lytic murein transglycosylase MltF
MDDLNKMLFAFAAYNAGPGRIRQLRRETAERGLDRNVWFDNVERIAGERIGRETVTYVSNIYKYYVTYLLIQGEYIQRNDLKKKAVTIWSEGARFDRQFTFTVRLSRSLNHPRHELHDREWVGVRWCSGSTRAPP